MSEKQRMQTLEMLENNVLINVKPNKNSTWAKEASEEQHSFYVPKEYTISHLRVYLNEKFFHRVIDKEKSYFLFAYGCILNNHERLQNIYNRFKHQIKDKDNGLEIRYAEMASFGCQ